MMGEIVLLKLCAYIVTLHLVHYIIFLSPMAKEAEEMVRCFINRFDTIHNKPIVSD
jgi:hypothetical protein